ncbi:MAG: hypothetical protein WCD37_06510 [Chloroflexia bacterium]
MSQKVSNVTTRPPKPPPALSIYLGPEPIASRRLEVLDALAGQLSISRSKMIQMLADGKLMLVVAPPDSTARRQLPEGLED